MTGTTAIAAPFGMKYGACLGVTGSPFQQPSQVTSPASITVLLDAYAEEAVAHAVVRQTSADKYLARVDGIGIKDVYGYGVTEDAACADLRDAIVEWLEIKIERQHKDIPVIANARDLNTL